MTIVTLSDVGQYGIIKDLPAHLLPPEAWSDGKNIRFNKEGVSRSLGHASALTPAPITPEFIFSIPGASTNFWLYTSLTKAYVFEAGVHTNITRQTAFVDVNYTATKGYMWQGTILGGVPLLNNGVDTPQFWSALSAGTKLANLTNFPANTAAKVLKAFGPYLVAINITESGTNRPHMVWWSHKTGPGTIPSSWDYTNAAVDAGRFELTDIEGGELLDALLLGDKLILYKASSTHAMRFIGGNDIFGAELLLSTAGILAPKCAAAFNKGTRHMVVTNDDVVVHAGTKEAESCIEDKDKKFLFNNIDQTNVQASFAFNNDPKKEVWFAFPENGATVPTIVAIWNYKDNVWTFRDFDGVATSTGLLIDTTAATWDTITGDWDSQSISWGKQSGRQILYTRNTTPHFFQLDSGSLFYNQNPVSYVLRQGLAVDSKDRQGKPVSNINSMKTFTRLWPKITGTDAITIKIGVQDNYNEEVTWVSIQNFNPLVDEYVDFNVTGRLLALSFETSTDKLWRLEGYDVDVTKVSEN